MILCLLSIDFNTCSLAYTSRIIIHILEFILNKYQFKKKNEKLSEHELKDGHTMNIQVLSQPANGYKLKVIQY